MSRCSKIEISVDELKRSDMCIWYLSLSKDCQKLVRLHCKITSSFDIFNLFVDEILLVYWIGFEGVDNCRDKGVGGKVFALFSPTLFVFDLKDSSCTQ